MAKETANKSKLDTRATTDAVAAAAVVVAPVVAAQTAIKAVEEVALSKDAQAAVVVTDQMVVEGVAADVAASGVASLGGDVIVAQANTGAAAGSDAAPAETGVSNGVLIGVGVLGLAAAGGGSSSPAPAPAPAPAPTLTTSASTSALQGAYVAASSVVTQDHAAVLVASASAAAALTKAIADSTTTLTGAAQAVADAQAAVTAAQAAVNAAAPEKADASSELVAANAVQAAAAGVSGMAAASVSQAATQVVNAGADVTLANSDSATANNTLTQAQAQLVKAQAALTAAQNSAALDTAYGQAHGTYVSAATVAGADATNVTAAGAAAAITKATGEIAAANTVALATTALADANTSVAQAGKALAAANAEKVDATAALAAANAELTAANAVTSSASAADIAAAKADVSTASAALSSANTDFNMATAQVTQANAAVTSAQTALTAAQTAAAAAVQAAAVANATVTAATNSFAEGASQTFTINAAGVNPGTQISYTVSGTGSAQVASTSGVATIDSSGRAVIQVAVPANSVIGDSGAVTFSLSNGHSITSSVTDATPTSFAAPTIAAANAGNTPVYVSMQGALNQIITLDASVVQPTKGFVVTNTGTGNLSINFLGATAGKSLTVNGAGTNNVILSSGALTSTDNIYFTGGVNTVTLSGAGNVVGNNTLVGVTTLEIGSGTVEFTSLAALATVKTVSDPNNSLVQVDFLGASTTADFSAETFYNVGTLKIQSTANSPTITVKLLGAQLAQIATIAAATSGTGTVTLNLNTDVAGFTSLSAANLAVFNGTKTVTDTAASIIAAGSTALANASIVATDASVSIAQAAQLYGISNTATYTVSDSAANLINAMVFSSNTGPLTTNTNATVSVSGVATVQQAKSLRGLHSVTYVISDTVAHVSAGVSNIGTWHTNVTGLNLTGNATVSQANTIGTWLGANTYASNVIGLNIVDTVANLDPSAYAVNALAQAAAASISLSSTGNSGSVAVISAIKTGAGAKFTGAYNLSDTSANLLNAASSLTKGAANIAVTDAIAVNVANQLALLGNTGSLSISVLNDSAANLASASSTILSGAASITSTSAATVQQATTLASFNVASHSLAVSDTAVNLVSANPSIWAKVGAVTATTPALLGQALTLQYINTTYSTSAPSYSVLDTVATIAGATSAAGYSGSTYKVALDAATGLTVTGNATVAQATSIYAANIGTHHYGVSSLVIADTAANIVAGISNGGVTGAQSVSITGTASISQYTTFAGLSNKGTYSISDSAANIAAYVNGGALNIAALNSSTAPVALSGSVTGSQATTLKGATTFTNWNGSYSIVDSYSGASVTSSPVRAAASSVIVQDSVNNINANYAWINANDTGSKFYVADTITNLLAAGNAIIVGNALAAQVTVTAGDSTVSGHIALSAADAKALLALNSNTNISVGDTYANLTLAANQAAVAKAQFIGIDTDSSAGTNAPSTVAQVQAVQAINPTATLYYSLSDTAANLAAAPAALLSSAASIVLSAGTATAAQLAYIDAAVNPNDVAASDLNLSVVDTAAHVTGLSTNQLNKLSSVVITDTNRITLNAAEASNFEVGGHNTWINTSGTNINAVTGSTSVAFNLSDTISNIVGLGTSSAVSGAGKITVIAGGTAADANAVAAVYAQNQHLSGTFSETVTAAEVIANATNEAIAVGLATAVSVSTGDTSTSIGGATVQLLTAAHATTLYGWNHASAFSVGDTLANIFTGNAVTTSVLPAIAHATNIVVTGAMNVAQLTALQAANPTATIAYALSDTATALAAASNAQLANASSIALSSGSATVAQIQTIDAARGAGHFVDIAISDTAANASTLTQAQLTALASSTMTLSGNVTAAQGATLNALHKGANTTISYTVSDSAANIAANAANLTNASSKSSTTAATAAQAVILAGLNATFTQVTDSSANLLNPDNMTAWAAKATTVTDTLSVATADLIKANVNGGSVSYNISDTTANIVSALGQVAAGGTPSASLNTVLGGATSVTLSDAGNAAVSLVSISNHYYASGSVATLKALPTSITSLGYVVYDTVANVLANYAYSTAGVSHAYVINDSAANILSGNSIVTGALTVAATDATVNAATAIALHTTQITAGGNVALAGTTITDVAANISNIITAAGYYSSSTVNVTGGISASNAASLYTANAHAQFSISDTSANISTAITSAAHATSVTITGAITAAQAGQLVAANASPTYSATYSISDAAAGGIFSNTTTTFANNVSDAGLKGATSVVVTSGMTGAQANVLYGDNVHATYSISGTDVFTSDAFTNSAAVNAATAVSGAFSNLDVKQAVLLEGLGAKFTGSLTVADTESNLATSATRGNLTQATAVSMTGTTTAANAVIIDALKYGSGSGTSLSATSITDGTANLLLAANGTAVAAATTVADTDVAISASQAGAVYAAASAAHANLSFAGIVDTSTNIELQPQAVIGDAVLVTVTDTLNTAQAAIVQGLDSGKVNFSKITDTYTNLALDTTDTGHATSVSLSTAATVANIESLQANTALYSKLTGGYSVADSAANILNAYYDGNYQSVITGANTVSLSSGLTATVVQAATLEGLTNFSSSSMNITDTVANVAGTSVGVLNAAASVTATDILEHGSSGITFNDSAISVPVTLSFTAGGTAAESITASGNTYTLAGVDMLTLKLGDSLNIHGMTNGSIVAFTSAQTLPTSATSGIQEIQGTITNNGGTFTASASGNSTLVVFWDGSHAAGIELVGVPPTVLISGVGVTGHTIGIIV